MKRFLAMAVLIAILAACGQGSQGGGESVPLPRTGAAGEIPPPISPIPVENATAPPPPAGSPAAGGETVSADTTTLVKRIFPEAAQVVPKSLGLDGHAGEDIGAKLGEPLEGHDLQSPALVATSADGRSLGAAWQTDAHVSAGSAATVLVGMGLDGKIRGVVVLGASNEGLEGSSFLGQFAGKSADQLNDPATVKPATGASAPDSREIATSVRRAALVLKEGLIQPTQHSH